VPIVSPNLGNLRPAHGNQSRAALARDAALARLSRTRRWVIAGAAVLTAGFAALVSAVAPGRSLASKKSSSGTETEAASASSSARGSSSAIPRMPPPANPSELGLQGPSQAPSSVPDQSQSQQQQSAPSPAPSAAPPQSSSGGGGPVVSGGS
jgi:hypothetical protein